MRTVSILALLALCAVGATIPWQYGIGGCEDPNYRWYRADAMFTGTVLDVRETVSGGDARTTIRFLVEEKHKGSLPRSYTLSQPGRITGGPWIPGWTLEWNVGQTWHIMARTTQDGRNELVCGALGRTQIFTENDCDPGITAARNPETQECRYFTNACQVPSGWQPVTSCKRETMPPGCSEHVIAPDLPPVLICTGGAPPTIPVFVPAPEAPNPEPVHARRTTPSPHTIVRTFIGGLF